MSACFRRRTKPIFPRRTQKRRIRYYVAAATFHPFRTIIFPCLRFAKHPTVFLCHRPQKKESSHYGKGWKEKLKGKAYTRLENTIESHDIQAIRAFAFVCISPMLVCESDRITLISRSRAYQKRLIKLTVKHLIFHEILSYIIRETNV